MNNTTGHIEAHRDISLYIMCIKQRDWQLSGATGCHGHKDMHNSCQSTGSQGLAAAAGAKGRAGACEMGPAAAELFGYSQAHSDFPQFASGPFATCLLQQEAEPGTSVKPGVLLGTAPYSPLRIWQLYQCLLPQCL